MIRIPSSKGDENDYQNKIGRNRIYRLRGNDNNWVISLRFFSVHQHWRSLINQGIVRTLEISIEYSH